MTDRTDTTPTTGDGLEILAVREPPASPTNNTIVAAAAGVTVVAGAVFAVGLLAGWAIGVYGTALGVGMLTLAVAVRRFFTDRYADVEAAEPRVTAADGDATAPSGPISDVPAVPRRTMLGRLVAAAAALFGLAVVAPPISSLGPSPAPALGQSRWRQGVRVVGDDGEPVTVDRVAAGGFANVWPEGAVGHELSAAILLRLPGTPEPPTNLDWVVGAGQVVYSKVCTHAGCPVSLFRERDQALFCPCHQSTFDVRRGAIPTFGPAARALPQLPLAVDEDGTLVALGDFDGLVGPTPG